MHEHLAAIQKEYERDNAGGNAPENRELFVGDVIQAAIHNDLRVETVPFPNGAYLDIGTPGDLVKAVRNMGSLPICVDAFFADTEYAKIAESSER